MINRRGGPNGSSPFATSRLKDARGELAGSRGSDCEVALRASVKSSTLRAKNPTWSRELASGWTPARKIEPKLGLNPTNQRTDIGSESHLNHFDITIGIHAVLPQQLHKKRCTRRWHQAGNHVLALQIFDAAKRNVGCCNNPNSCSVYNIRNDVHRGSFCSSDRSPLRTMQGRARRWTGRIEWQRIGRCASRLMDSMLR